MSSLRQYDPLKVTGAFQGLWGSVDILDGAVYGDFLNVTRDEQLWGRETDGFGNSIRVRRNNISGRITLQLSASSPTNFGLYEIAMSDAVAETNIGYMTLRDLNGDITIVAAGVWIADFPQITFGVNRGARTWVFECAAIQIVQLSGHDKA